MLIPPFLLNLYKIYSFEYLKIYSFVSPNSIDFAPFYCNLYEIYFLPKN